MPAERHRTLRYLPSLRSQCGNSIGATIMMAQLEYWFSKYNDGFYKFLAPCQHARYKAGDSWVEELNMTPHEFRVAFDKIGRRYKSKRQWQSVVDQGKDPFGDRFYCSYVDVRLGLTYYVRHHDRVAALLSKKVATILPNHRQPTVLSRDAHSGFPKIKPGHSTTSISENQKTGAVIIKETKTNHTDDSKKTATTVGAAHQSSSNSYRDATTSVKQSAAAVIDQQIGKSLTTSQQAHLRVVVQGLLSCFPEVDATTLTRGIQQCLCDFSAYTQAGADFFKKLNTIQKAIRAGTWRLPIAISKKTISAMDKQQAHWQQQWLELKGEQEQLQTMMASMQKQGKPHVLQQLQQQLTRCCHRLQVVETALQQANRNQ